MDLNKEHWTSEDYRKFKNYLTELVDEKYREFNKKLVPGCEAKVLGIRMPVLHMAAKEIARHGAQSFIEQALAGESDSIEETTILGLVIGYAGLPFGAFSECVRRFAARVESWASCDAAVSSFKQIRELTTEFKIEIRRFLHSDDPWEQRVGLVILLDHYLKNEEDTRYALDMTNGVKSENYYVNMAQAWLICEALARHRDLTLGFIKNEFALGGTVAKMTAQKIRDSHRISDKDKAEIGALLVLSRS